MIKKLLITILAILLMITMASALTIVPLAMVSSCDSSDIAAWQAKCTSNGVGVKDMVYTNCVCVSDNYLRCDTVYKDDGYCNKASSPSCNNVGKLVGSPYCIVGDGNVHSHYIASNCVESNKVIEYCSNQDCGDGKCGGSPVSKTPSDSDQQNQADSLNAIFVDFSIPAQANVGDTILITGKIKTQVPGNYLISFEQIDSTFQAFTAVSKRNVCDGNLKNPNVWVVGSTNSIIPFELTAKGYDKQGTVNVRLEIWTACADNGGLRKAWTNDAKLTYYNLPEDDDETTSDDTKEFCVDEDGDVIECPPEDSSYCGDGVCAINENSNNCVYDCGKSPVMCGDGKCDSGESSKSCSEDCKEGQGESIIDVYAWAVYVIAGIIVLFAIIIVFAGLKKKKK